MKRLAHLAELAMDWVELEEESAAETVFAGFRRCLPNSFAELSLSWLLRTQQRRPVQKWLKEEEEIGLQSCAYSRRLGPLLWIQQLWPELPDGDFPEPVRSRERD